MIARFSDRSRRIARRFLYGLVFVGISYVASMIPALTGSKHHSSDAPLLPGDTVYADHPGGSDGAPPGDHDGGDGGTGGVDGGGTDST